MWLESSRIVVVALRFRDCDLDAEVDSLLWRDLERDLLVLFTSVRTSLESVKPLDSELGLDEELVNSFFLDFDNDLVLDLALVLNLEADFDLDLDGDLLE